MKDNNDTKVSIIVPVYNVEQYLDQCIQSLIDQTYENIEIILVNDGSRDRSSAICRRYVDIDERIIYIDQANQGVSAARNNGLKRATGEWVAFVDSDDYTTLDMISSLLDGADKCDIIIGEAYILEGAKASKISFFDSQIPDEKKKDLTYLIGNAMGCWAYGFTGYANVGVPWARLYRKEFLIENQIEFTVGIGRMQDMLMNIKAFSCAPTIKYINKPVYYYRITSDSACHRYNPTFEKTAEKILNCIRETVGNNQSPEIRDLYTFKKISLLFETFRLYYCHPECELPVKEKLTGIKQICENTETAIALKSFNKALFPLSRRIVLWFLAHRFYGTAYCIFTFRNKLKELRATRR